MNIGSTYLKLKKILAYMILKGFRELNATYNISPETRVKILDDFERAEADAHLWRAGHSNMNRKGMTICYIMNRCLIMFLRGGKVNVVEY